METVKGRFLWHELCTTDVEGAKAFYSEVIGWSTQEWDSPDMDYTMFQVGERGVAGLMLLPEEAKAMGAPPHWMGYVGTPDTDATLKQAEDLGGNALAPPFDIPKVGRFALIQDPQGAVLSAFTPVPDDPPMPDPGPIAGTISWNECMSTDAAAALRFYQALYDWQADEPMDMGPMGLYHLFSVAGKQVGGLMNKPAEMPAPPHWLYYIKVDGLAAALERVQANSGQVLNGPMEIPGGEWVAQCVDPQGAAFALHSVSK